MLYVTGASSGVEYETIYGDKDTRRIEMCVAVFWKGHETPEAFLYNVFEPSTEHMTDLLRLMPSFRKMAKGVAKTKDAELGEAAVAKLAFKSYEARIKEALGDLPVGLEMLHELVHPVNKAYKVQPKVLDKDAEGTVDPYENLPESIEDFIEWAQANGLVSREDKGVAATELVVKWCEAIGEFSDKQWTVQKYEYEAKRAQRDTKAEKQRHEVDKQILRRRFEEFFPKYTKITEKYDELQAKLKAERAAWKKSAAEAKAEPGNEESTDKAA